MQGIPRRLVVAGAFGLLFASASAGHADRKDPNAPVRDADHRFQREVKSWRELKRQNVVTQQRDYSCGAAALATLIRYYWQDDVDEPYFLRQLDQMLTAEEIADRIRNGLTMTDLRRVAVKSGYQASMGRIEYEKLTESKVPLVVGIKVQEYRHFVVYRGTDGEYVYLADPIRGNIRTPVWEFVEQWQEQAVLAVVKPNEKIKDFSPLSVHFDEVILGELNKDLIEKTYFRTPAPFPTSIRP